MNEQVINFIILILVACACGLTCNLLNVPVLVGYILGGCLVNTFVGSMVFDQNMIHIIAEIGVILLLFVVGLELNLHKFYDVLQRGALLALFQIFFGLILSYAILRWFNLPLNQVPVMGFCLAISSTAVVLSLIQQQKLAAQRIGRLLVAIVLFQDLALAPMIVALSLDMAHFILSIIKLILSFLFLMLVVNYIFYRKSFRLNWFSRVCKQQETVMLLAISMALISAVTSFALDLSYAYGAFLSGLVIGNSSVGSNVLRSVAPVQHLTILFFFFSIGLMLDLNFILQNLKMILTYTAMVILVKFSMNFLILLLIREKPIDALWSGVILSQIGEFSFVLISFSSNTIGYDSQYLQFITILIAFSLMISPVLYTLLHALQKYSSESRGKRLSHAKDSS